VSRAPAPDPPQAAQIAPQTPETRVVTHRGRRTSVRLEPVFWTVLERMAAAQGVRVGTLVGRLAESHAGGNLTAHLRTVCLLDAERRAADGWSDARAAGPGRLVQWAPSPALIVAGDTTILDQNTALERWLGQPSLIGQRLAEAFRVRTRKPLRELWAAMQSTGRPIAGLGVVRISAGRVQAAEATVVPTRPGTPAQDDAQAGPAPQAGSAVVWLAVRGSRAARGREPGGAGG
jgi:predicted DNA-binding ribbon-helix-helix protein